MAVSNPRQGTTRDGIAASASCDLCQRLLIVDAIHRSEAFALARAFKRFERQIAKHLNRLGPHGDVAVLARNPTENGGIRHLGNRRASDLRALVLERRGNQLLALIDWQRFDVG